VGLLTSFPYLSGNLSTYLCQSCSLLYLHCLDCTGTACTACSSGYLLGPSSNCLSSCPNGYLNVSSFCALCSSECLGCSALLYNCSACSGSYLLFLNTTTSVYRCLSVCPPGTFSQGGVCSSCLAPCLTCANSSSQCLTCTTGYLSLNSSNAIQCVSACPSSSYPYQSSCVLCSPSCAQCDPSGCLQCGSG
jgi:hypothetical protein